MLQRKQHMSQAHAAQISISALQGMTVLFGDKTKDACIQDNCVNPTIRLVVMHYS